MTSQFKAASQLELVDTQIRLARANIASLAQERLIEGYAASVAAFTRANLIISTTDFHERNEQEHWTKLKQEAYKLQAQYEAKLANIQLSTPAAPVSEADHPFRLSDEEKVEIERLYANGTPAYKIGELIGRSTNAVTAHLNKATTPQNGKHS